MAGSDLAYLIKTVRYRPISACATGWLSKEIEPDWEMAAKQPQGLRESLDRTGMQMMKGVPCSSWVTVMVGLCSIAILSACATTQEAQKTQAPVFEVKPVPQPPAKPKSKPLENSPYLVHRVKWPNETLYLIAKWYTGRTENWKTIAETNPELDPRRIRLGTEIKIPAELLQTIVPMPREFVQGSGSKPTK